MDLLANPIVIGLLIGLPSVVLGILGYRRSKKVDVASDASVAISQIIDGLNKLTDNLQVDNKELRREITSLQSRLTSTVTERDELKRRIVALGGMLCLVALLILGVESVKQDQERLVDRAAQVARHEVRDDATKRNGTIGAAVQAEVTEQVDDALATTTTAAPIVTVPIPLPTTPTTSTTSTTTTTLAPPTTVTIPVTLPTVPITLP